MSPGLLPSLPVVALLWAVAAGEAPLLATARGTPPGTGAPPAASRVPTLQVASQETAQGEEEGVLLQEPPETLPTLFFQDTLTADTLPAERVGEDQRIALALRSVFQRIDELSNVVVQVEAGVVRLTGTVLTPEARELAAELAGRTPGVIFVDGRIREIRSLGARLRTTQDHLRDWLLELVATLPLLLTAFLLVWGFWVVGTGVKRLVRQAGSRARNPYLGHLGGQTARALVAFAGIFLALELLGSTRLLGVLLGSAGVVGIALGFAFRDIAENYLAGVLMGLRQPFAPNDIIRLDTHEGKVVRLTGRETILMTYDGNHVRIPNATVFRSVIQNFSRNPLRRFVIPLSVGTADDLSAAKAVGIGALRSTPGVREDPPPFASIQELGDSSVTLHFFGWVDQREAAFGRVRSEGIRAVKLALENAGVSMPSPEYRVVLDGGVVALPEPGRASAPGPGPRSGAPLGALPAEEAVEPAPEPSPDDVLDRQIAEDRRQSQEPDLLVPEGLEESGGGGSSH